jgi:hypothetical protein
LSFGIAQVKSLCAKAREAGCEISEWDYGFSAGCRRPGTDRHLLIAEVFRKERDGYIGGRIISEEMLDEWLKAKS